MFAYNLRLNVGEIEWKNSKSFYNSERQIVIDRYRDGCQRNPCCRKLKLGIKQPTDIQNEDMWPLPPFIIWSNGKFINHVMCFFTENEAYRWLLQWINGEKKKFCGKWDFPNLHVKNVFGIDVSSFLHPVIDDGNFISKMTNYEIQNDNFWNGYTMETYQSHDIFLTNSHNSIDSMPFWNINLATWANEYIKSFYDMSFPSHWDIKLTMSQ